MKLRNYLVLLLVALLPSLSSAQKTSNSLCYNIPSDSLMFMLYMNKANIEDQAMLNEMVREMPDEVAELANNFDEFCVYGQSQAIYDVFRLDFKTSAPVNMDQMNKMLEEFNLKVKDFTEGMVILEGGQYVNGYFYKGQEYSTLKIYTQTTVIDETLRADYENVRELLMNLGDRYYDYDLRMEYNHKLDSISQLDSLASKTFFNDLIRAEQQNLAKGESVQKHKSVMKVKPYVKDLIEGKPAVMYVDAKYMAKLPYYLLFDAFSISKLKDIKSMTSSLVFYDKSWISASVNETKIEFETIVESSEGKHFSKKLDKNIIKYLPAKTPESFAIFNINIPDLKMYLLENFYVPDLNGEQRGFAKMALLAIDDDILESIGNGFIAINEGEAMGRDLPNFKAVFELPNVQKGQMLMDILCEEFDVFTEVAKNTYVIKERWDDEEQINICITGNVWIIGTAPVEELKKINASDVIKGNYPMFGTKGMVQYAKVSESLFGSSNDMFKDAELKSKLINKKVLKTTVVINR